MGRQQLVYVTGYNATGKTTLGKNLVLKESFSEQGWHCIDGDDFVGEIQNPDLYEMLVSTSQSGNIMERMRGTLTLEDRTEEERYEEVKKLDAEVKRIWEPYYRTVFERLRQHMSDKHLEKVVFPYHCWRSWMIDLVREYFGQEGCKCTIVEVTTDAKLRYQRWVERQVPRGLDVEKRWREDPGDPMATLRNAYGPEYKGNEENFLKFVEHRYFFPREPMPQNQADIFFIKNDNFDGLKELERIVEQPAGNMAAPTEHQINMIKQLFKDADEDGNGLICREELESVLKKLGDWVPEEFDVLFSKADLNSDGRLSYDEFVTWVMEP